MILIGDSGSTKADWAFVEGAGKPVLVSSAGINPLFTDTGRMEQQLRAAFRGAFPHDAVKKIFFYGAGCVLPTHCNVVRSALKTMFVQAEVHVDSDMPGAARALFGSAPGIACILGTGSNSCRWSGDQITENIPPLGYIIGDEGSGTHIGKLLLRSYLRNQMPQDIRRHFEFHFQISRENVIEAVYNKPRGNVYIASFASFLAGLTEYEYTKDLVIGAFREFFINHVSRYPEYDSLPLGCVGSIGYHFSDYFRVVARKYGCEVSKILKSPLQGLIEFHQSDIS